MHYNNNWIDSETITDRINYMHNTFQIGDCGEMFNTSLEKAMDYVSKDYNEKIRFIKDVSAEGILVLAAVSAISVLYYLSQNYFNL